MPASGLPGGRRAAACTVDPEDGSRAQGRFWAKPALALEPLLALEQIGAHGHRRENMDGGSMSHAVPWEPVAAVPRDAGRQPRGGGGLRERALSMRHPPGARTSTWVPVPQSSLSPRPLWVPGSGQCPGTAGARQAALQAMVLPSVLGTRPRKVGPGGRQEVLVALGPQVAAGEVSAGLGGGLGGACAPCQGSASWRGSGASISGGSRPLKKVPGAERQVWLHRGRAPGLGAGPQCGRRAAWARTCWGLCAQPATSPLAALLAELTGPACWGLGGRWCSVLAAPSRSLSPALNRETKF